MFNIFKWVGRIINKESTKVYEYPGAEFKNIKTGEVLFENDTIYGYIPSVNSTMKRSGKMYQVVKVFANYDITQNEGAPFTVWIKEIPDD